MLNDVLNISASALAAAGTRLAVTADNIANADTPGYQARRVDLVELSGGGVGIAGIRPNPPDPLPPLADGMTRSDVDLASEAVDLERERAFYNANAAVVHTADKMLGTLIDMVDSGHHRHRAG